MFLCHDSGISPPLMTSLQMSAINFLVLIPECFMISAVTYFVSLHLPFFNYLRALSTSLIVTLGSLACLPVLGMVVGALRSSFKCIQLFVELAENVCHSFRRGLDFAIWVTS